MLIAYLIVTSPTATLNIAATVADFQRPQWLLDNMTKYALPHRRPFGLTVKAVGALGLLVGIGVPAIGLLAAGGVVGYYIGAIITVARSG